MNPQLYSITSFHTDFVQEQLLKNEIAIMKKVCHENCVAFYDSKTQLFGL